MVNDILASIDNSEGLDFTKIFLVRVNLIIIQPLFFFEIIILNTANI